MRKQLRKGVIINTRMKLLENLLYKLRNKLPLPPSPYAHTLKYHSWHPLSIKKKERERERGTYILWNTTEP